MPTACIPAQRRFRSPSTTSRPPGTSPSPEDHQAGIAGIDICMGRSTRDEYLTTADYAFDWGDNLGRMSTGHGGSEAEAMQHAADFVRDMRREGVKSPIRLVRVRHWPGGSKLAGGPLVYQASYYDAEQGLADAEAYAARVHDWHVSVDRVNRNLTRTNASWRLGYSPWLDASGPKPASCPGCGADLGVLV